MRTTSTPDEEDQDWPEEEVLSAEDADDSGRIRFTSDTAGFKPYIWNKANTLYMVIPRMAGCTIKPACSGDGTLAQLVIIYPLLKPEDLEPGTDLLSGAGKACQPHEGTARFRPLAPGVLLRDRRAAPKQPANKDFVMFTWQIIRSSDADCIVGEALKWELNIHTALTAEALLF